MTPPDSKSTNAGSNPSLQNGRDARRFVAVRSVLPAAAVTT
jgi:hypothetical protein